MRSRGVAVTISILFVLTLASGCGSNEPEPADEASSPTPTAEPADGKLIDSQRAFRFRMPSDLDWSFDSTGGVAEADGGIVNIVADETRSYDATLEEEFDVVFGVLQDYGRYAEYRRAENITVDGVEGWVITAGDERQDYYQFGTVHKGRNASLEFSYPPDYAGADDMIESVLASVEWK